LLGFELLLDLPLEELSLLDLPLEELSSHFVGTSLDHAMGAQVGHSVFIQSAFMNLLFFELLLVQLQLLSLSLLDELDLSFKLSQSVVVVASVVVDEAHRSSSSSSFEHLHALDLLDFELVFSLLSLHSPSLHFVELPSLHFVVSGSVVLAVVYPLSYHSSAKYIQKSNKAQNEQ